MPHRIDFDSIHEDAFLLLNLCYAGKEFSHKHKLTPDAETQGVNHAYYFGWLKYQLSEKLISSAIKTRITLDFLKEEDPEVDSTGEDRNICKRYKLGHLEGDSAHLSVREVCNKVIHADSVSPEIEVYDNDCERWNGWIDLNGTKGRNKWRLHLDLAAFCLALDELIVFLEENYDWHRVYKYD